MYDNFDMTLTKDKVQGIDLLKSTPQFLSKVTSEGTSQFGEYVNGYLDTLKIKVTESKVQIYNSSICKYYLGNNFHTLSKEDTKQAIEKISDILHLPFHLSNITRIDFAQNLIMKFPESVYYSYLGQAQYYNRLEQNNGLYYSNQKRQLLFYGKEYEQRVKGQPIPELYQNKNVLRFELRFKKQLRKQFNKPEITAKLLYENDFYNNLVIRWKNEYLAIQKIKSKLINMKATGSKKQFINNLAQFSILEIGQPQILNKVKEWQTSNKIDKKQAYELRKAVKQISKIQLNERSNELINELDKKIKEAAIYS